MQNTNMADSQDRETRLRFMRISSATGEALREFWPVVEKQLPRILEDFYKQLTAEPNLVKIIGNNHVSRLVSAQSSHWSRLFSGQFDEAYIQGVRTIGMVHNRIGLEPRWYIGGYALVLSHLTDLAIKTYRWKAEASERDNHGCQQGRHAGYGFRHLGLSGSYDGRARQTAESGR